MNLRKSALDPNDVAFATARHNDLIGGIPCPLGGNGVVNPHVTRFYHADRRTSTSVFHVKPIYYETIYGAWRPMEEVCVHAGNQTIILKEDWQEKMSLRFFLWLMKRQLLLGSELRIAANVLQPRHMVFDSTTTVYPDPHPETTTVDGEIYMDDPSWSVTHDAATGDGANDTSTSGYYMVRCDGTSGYTIGRGFTLFDTSSIPDTDEISAAVNSYYGSHKVGTTSDYCAIVQTNPASNTALTTADFDAMAGSVHEDTIGSDTITNAAWNVGSYNDFTFDATGLSWIDKTGVTKLGMRYGEDYEETASHSNPPDTTQTYRGYTKADYSGTSQDPKLAVTHAAAAVTLVPPQLIWW